MPKLSRAVALTAMLLSATVTQLYAADQPRIGDTAKGKTLVDARGMTLYTFAKDANGNSACNGPCAQEWPPLLANNGAVGTGPFSTVTRADGDRQWAYRGKPLYIWSRGQQPGDIAGDDFLGSVWRVATP